MLPLIAFLIFFPVVVAIAAWVAPARARAGIAYVGAAAIIAASVAVGAPGLVSEPVYVEFSSEAAGIAAFVVDVFLAFVVAWHAVRQQRPIALVLAVAQLGIGIALEVVASPFAGIEVPCGFCIDALTSLMVLVVGIVGGVICIYAVGYMKDYAHHLTGEDAKRDRPGFFFAMMFFFLGAMFLLVLANNLLWLYTGWEATTVLSFLLIGYARTDEAIRNAFRQIILNLVGGIAFGIGLLWLAVSSSTMSFGDLVALGEAGMAVVPVTLIAFAALVKAAQMPFQSWLLGAMVAPTPTSALLHSSTMVKAGIFVLIRLSTCLGLNAPGLMVVLIGGITFLFTAAMAVAETNAKRVLAYSTISNLGLMAMCAGLGTPEGAWAAIFLLAFHAVTKAMLFMCVGTAEHHIGSRDIERMDNLIVRMPRLARVMAVGIMAMFVAPFGMLISKWGAIVSIADTGNLLLLIFVAFGSALTFFFWAKWLGKVSAQGSDEPNVEKGVHGCEWLALYVCLVVLIALCLCLPIASGSVVEPYLLISFGFAMAPLDTVALVITAVVVAALVVAYFAFYRRAAGRRNAAVYMAGVGSGPSGRAFANSLGGETAAESRNLRLAGWFSEDVLTRPGNIACLAVICVCILVAVIFGGGFSLPSGMVAAAFMLPEGAGLVPAIIGAVAFVVIGPFIGMLLMGLDRKITARMQGRVGPPLLQPLYDVRKLFAKERSVSSDFIDFDIAAALALAVVSGAVFFSGGNLLLAVFLLTLSSLFLVVAGYSARSPYADVGAQRENLQVMAYEPLMILMPISVYLCTGTFAVSGLASLDLPAVAAAPLVFVAFIYVLTIKMRKSPFDLSMSHHAHQELVKGITTEMSGRTLALMQVMEWYELTMFLGMVGMFFVSSAWWSWIVAVVAALAAFFLEILIDNNFARVKWQTMLTSSWVVIVIAFAANAVIWMVL